MVSPNRTPPAKPPAHPKALPYRNAKNSPIRSPKGTPAKIAVLKNLDICGTPPNVPDQRLAALRSAFTHDDAREPFASGGYVAD
jgi:hypothetical protein